MTHCGIQVDDNGVMMRPTRRDEVVRRRAAELALPQVKRWIGYTTDSDNCLITQLMNHIGGGDGYEIVKSLEQDGWCGNDSLVDIMGEDFIGAAEEELVAQWVRCLSVKLNVPIGAQVTIKRRKEVGIVTKHYPDVAKYGVRTAEQPETSCWVLLPEEISASAWPAARMPRSDGRAGA